MKTNLLVNEIAVVNRLHEKFGASKEVFIQIVEAGRAGRNECTPHHPSSMAGIRCWGDATRALRDCFVPLGWECDNTDNIPSVVNRKRNLKIAICNTDAGTGLELGHPQPIREKGDGAQRAVQSNHGQGILGSILTDTFSGIQPGSDSFWYLCIFCCAGMYRAELLCPIFDEDGSFKNFRERIALISDGDDNDGFRVQNEDPKSPEGDSGFEISVTRKQATL